MSSYEMRMALESAGTVGFPPAPQVIGSRDVNFFHLSLSLSRRLQANQQPFPAAHPALHRGRHVRRLRQLRHVSGQTGDHVQ